MPEVGGGVVVPGDEPEPAVCPPDGVVGGGVEGVPPAAGGVEPVLPAGGLEGLALDRDDPDPPPQLAKASATARISAPRIGWLARMIRAPGRAGRATTCMTIILAKADELPSVIPRHESTALPESPEAVRHQPSRSSCHAPHFSPRTCPTDMRETGETLPDGVRYHNINGPHCGRISVTDWRISGMNPGSATR